MATANGITVEQRLKRLEEEIRNIREILKKASDAPQTGWKSIVGTHKNDPDFGEVVRLGKEIRDKDLVLVWRKRKGAKTKRKASVNK